MRLSGRIFRRGGPGSGNSTPHRSAIRSTHAHEVGRGIGLGHHADTRERLAAAPDRDDPRKPARRDLAAEMDLDVAGRAGRQLPLRGVEQQRWHAKAQLSMQRVPPAACEHTRARVEGWLVGDVNRDAIGRRL